jgi:hypothetical protein
MVINPVTRIFMRNSFCKENEKDGLPSHRGVSTVSKIQLIMIPRSTRDHPCQDFDPQAAAAKEGTRRIWYSVSGYAISNETAHFVFEIIVSQHHLQSSHPSPNRQLSWRSDLLRGWLYLSIWHLVRGCTARHSWSKSHMIMSIVSKLTIKRKCKQTSCPVGYSTHAYMPEPPFSINKTAAHDWKNCA